MAISAEQARGVFTNQVIEVFSDAAPVPSFLREFFTTKESPTKYVSIEVQRNNEYVATDVYRGTEGNRNSFSKSTEKIFEPPLYKEYFDATQLDIYDRAIGAPNDAALMSAAVGEFAGKMVQLRNKIERAYEKQIAEIFLSGTVTLVTADQVNFKRKSGSFVTTPTWLTGSNDPATICETAGNFLRSEGKMQGGVINMILADDALNALLKNDTFKSKADIRKYDLANIMMPNRNASGAVYHGTFSAGSYQINVWTYPQFYDASASSKHVPYITAKKAIFLPQSPAFTLAFGAVPKLIGEGPAQGAYHLSEFMDARKKSHEFVVESAGIAVPVGVDQIFTATVLA